MNKIKNKIIASLLICFILIPSIDSKAFFLVSDIKVAPEISLGFNAISVLKTNKESMEKIGFNKNMIKDTTIKNSTPFSGGIMLGYKIWFFEPEIGFKFASTQYVELTDLYRIEEKFFEIPIRFNFVWNIIPSMFGLKFLIGYKINIPTSAKYEVKSKSKIIDKFGSSSPMLKSNDNLKSDSNYPSSSGSFLFGLGFCFPYGTYLNFHFSIPIDAKSLTKEDLDEIKNKKLEDIKPNDKIFVLPHRIVAAPLFVTTFGVDIMKIIF